MLDFNELLKSLFSSLTILAILSYFGKEVINVYLSKNLELFKQKLSQELELQKQRLNQDMESAKTKLSMMATEHQVKFSKLHQERAKLIKQLWSAITQFESYLTGYINIMNNPELRDQSKAWKGGTAVFIPSVLEIYNDNKIYFGSSMCREVDAFLIAAKGITDKIMMADPAISPEDARHLQKELKDFLDRSILPLKADLEGDFRVLLGVEKQ